MKTCTYILILPKPKKKCFEIHIFQLLYLLRYNRVILRGTLLLKLSFNFAIRINSLTTHDRFVLTSVLNSKIRKKSEYNTRNFIQNPYTMKIVWIYIVESSSMDLYS